MTAADGAVYLASTSPRRYQLLRQVGIEPLCLEVAIDESLATGESAEVAARRLALGKSAAGWEHPGRSRPLPVIGADTLVICDHAVLGKPADRDAALTTLRRLGGRWHEVISAVAVTLGDRSLQAMSRTRVLMRPIGAAEAEAYWRSGEPRDKAGGYALQGLAAAFVERIEGSCSGVIGLPLFETVALLRRFEVKLPGLT